MTVLILSEEDVRELLPMDECIEAMDEVLRSLARGELHQPLRSMSRPEDGQGLIGLMREIFLPAARILLHHQPAADVEHQGGGKQNDKAFQDVAVVARVQHRKQPGRNKAGSNGGERAGI